MAAGYWSTFFSRISTFRKEYVVSEALPTYSYGGFDTFGRYEARLMRYYFYWTLYENTAYDTVHLWAETFKTLYSLYRYTRGIYNPWYRLGEFWATHLMGGQLDSNAGDGYEVPSALPIITANDALRPAIAELWRASNWQMNKEAYSRLGAVLGDVGLKTVDDPVKEMVAIEVVHPGTIKWVDLDRWGNVCAYIIEENRVDPEFSDKETNPFLNPADTRMIVRYTEKCYLDGQRVCYETYRNNEPYAWNGVAEKWDVPYGFVPLRLHQHLKVSPTIWWGWSEYHTGGAKGREVDDLGSKLHDQVRKAVEGMFFIAGAQPPKGGVSPTAATATATVNNPDPGRQETKVMYAGLGATATPLMCPLDIQFTSIELQNQINELEKDYPELLYQAKRVSGDASGKAIREIRKGAEAKVHARRAGYDYALVRAHQDAISIGGWRGYRGYEGFGLDSFQAGNLDHSIGQRPVFLLDPIDKIEQQDAIWQAGHRASQAGYPLVCFLRDNGWTEAQVQSYLKEKAAADQQATASATAQAQAQAVATGKLLPSGDPPLNVAERPKPMTVPAVAVSDPGAVTSGA